MSAPRAFPDCAMEINNWCPPAPSRFTMIAGRVNEKSLDPRAQTLFVAGAIVGRLRITPVNTPGKKIR